MRQNWKFVATGKFLQSFLFFFFFLPGPWVWILDILGKIQGQVMNDISSYDGIWI